MTVDQKLLRCLVLALAAAALWPSHLRAQESQVVRQIEVEVQFVEFSMSDIGPLSAKGSVDVEGLKALQQDGKGQLLAAPKLVTHSGAEASVKVVTECIYPTKLEVHPPSHDHTNEISGTLHPVVVPADFATREVGAILAVLPEVSRDGTLISLTIRPELVSAPDWKEYSVTYTDAQGEERESCLEQPFFHTRAISSSLTVSNGATLLLGGGGSLPGRDKDSVIYLFLTAQLVDANGKPIGAE